MQASRYDVALAVQALAEADVEIREAFVLFEELAASRVITPLVEQHSEQTVLDPLAATPGLRHVWCHPSSSYCSATAALVLVWPATALCRALADGCVAAATHDWRRRLDRHCLTPPARGFCWRW